ncbi:TPA: hypothetical protein QHK82_003514 [Citrobacter koseri]|nr:hypothetical protein [Citrobacter koseri]
MKRHRAWHRMAAQTPYPAYGSEFCRPGKRSATGMAPDGGASALSGLRERGFVGPVSKAPPGIAPDGGANALSGLRERDFVGPVSKAPPGRQINE